MKPNIEYVKQEMERRKWTGSQLAMKMGISRMEVSRLLRGKRVGGKKCIGGLIKAFPDAELKDLFFLDWVELIVSTERRTVWNRSRISMTSVFATKARTARSSLSERKTVLHESLPMQTEHSRLRMSMRSKFKQKSARAPDDSTDT